MILFQDHISILSSRRDLIRNVIKTLDLDQITETYKDQ